MSSDANIRRWSKVSKKTRSETLRKVVQARWAKTGLEGRYKQAMLMVAGRNKKRKLL